MKKILSVMLLLAMFAGCAGTQEPKTGAVVSEEAATPAEADFEEVTVLATPSGTTPVTDAPLESFAPKQTPTPADAVDLASCRSGPLDAPLLHEITLREVNWELLSAGKPYDTTFRNETADFKGCQFLIEDFRSDTSGTQFTIRLSLPEDWTDLQCLSMNPCFGFRFYLDDKAQHDFRLIDQSTIFGEEIAKTRCDSFTMTYRSETVTDTVMHAAHEWRIVPFFYYRKMFHGSNYNDHPGGRLYLEQGETVRFNGTEDAYGGGTIGVTELDTLSIQLSIEHTVDLPGPAREPKMMQVTIWTEDVERNKAAGHYGPDGRLKDGSYVLYGTYRNETVDFSELEFHIERFYYWEHGFFYTLHIVYPESWSEEVIQNARFDIEAYADGEPYGKQVRDGRVARPYFKSTGGWLSPGNDRSHLTEQYLVHDQKNFSLSDPIPKQELTFKVWLEYFPTIRFDNSDKEIDITNGEPYYMESIHEYASMVDIPLTEFSISTDTFTFSQGGAQ